MSIHRKLTGEQVHTPITWEYDDATARTSPSGFLSTDIGKIAWQKDDDSFWILKTVAPIWISFFSDAPSDDSVYGRKNASWVKVDAAGAISPSVSTGTATSVAGNGFVVPVTLNSFGSIDTTRMVLSVQYRETGSSTWLETSGTSVITLDTFNLIVTGLSVTTEYDYRAKGYDELAPGNFSIGDTNTETTASIYIDAPVNSSPADTESDIGETPTFSASTFNCTRF